MICAVVGCEMQWALKPRRVDVKAPTSQTVSQPHLRFEVELCRLHFEAFDSRKHTVLVNTWRVREPA